MTANNKGKDLLIGAVAGTLLGAVAALLFAPKAGRELRSDIAEGVQNVTEKTQDVVETVADKSKQIAEVISEKTQAAIQTIGRSTSEWKEKGKASLRFRNDSKQAEAGGTEAPVAATVIEREDNQL